MLFEDFFDYDKHARSKFHAYVHRLCHEEGALLVTPDNLYVRTQRSPSDVEGPVMTYVELDEERWPVRKVEVFADGLGYAEGKGSFGNTILGEHPLPPLDSSAPGSSEISRDEFETIWDDALTFEESVDNADRAT